jgi:hypothetical membrane protein
VSRLGPLVPKQAHWAGLLLLGAAVEFTGGMVGAQVLYPGYSDVSNAISDLGNSVHSPGYLLFNGSLLAFGLLGLAGTYLLRSAFRARRTAYAGLGLLGLTFAAALAIALFPENVNGRVHSASTEVAFIASGLALLVLALAMLRDTRWDRWRLYTALSGAVILVAIAVFVSSLRTGADFGILERAVVAPGLLWAALTGVHLVRIPVLGSMADRSDGGGGPTAEAG